MFLLLLILPLGFIIFRAYQQLSIESFLKQRTQAEELAEVIDKGFHQFIEKESERHFEAYAYIDVSQSKARISELAAMPNTLSTQGLISYFQIAPNGEFSSPLLPLQFNNSHPLVQLTKSEKQQRREIMDRCFHILNNNKFQESWGVNSQPLVNNYKQFLESKDNLTSSFNLQKYARGSRYNKSIEMSLDAVSEEQFAEPNEIAINSTYEKSQYAPTQADMPQKLSELSYDNRLQQQAALPEVSQKKKLSANKLRSRRTELNLVSKKNRKEEKESLPIKTIKSFAGDVDPFRLEILNSGEFVFFRSIWRNGKRTIQGFLIEPKLFLKTMLLEPLQNDAQSSYTKIIAGFNDTILYSSHPRLKNVNNLFLLKHYITSPFQNLQLIFSLTRLPEHSGTTLLNSFVTILMIILFIGILGLYKIGVQQINLAQQQHDFVASVSHELKTPLTSIRMYGEMLRSGWVTDEKRKNYYDFIFFESERLSRLINNVLQLSKLSHSQNDMPLTQHTPDQLIDLIQSKVSTQVESAQFTMDLMTPEKPPKGTLFINEDAFSQIMINLVDNALKFSKDSEPKKIEIGYNVTDQNVSFFVSDYGPGISKEQEKYIFNLFYRAENELTRKTQGTGIGLALVSELAQRMNGQLELHHREQGLDFRCSFSIEQS